MPLQYSKYKHRLVNMDLNYPVEDESLLYTVDHFFNAAQF